MEYLNYNEIILLDVFIYLECYIESGTVLKDYIDYLTNGDNLINLLNESPSCHINKSAEEWMFILKLINNNEKLSKLIVYNMTEQKSSMKAACFIGSNKKAYVIFRGTTRKNEWDDNGKGVYLEETEEQIDALNYIENLEFDDIVVSGHSKGGNMAQYSAILSEKVIKCVSINGQGFSNDFIDKYKKKINENRDKIECINCQYDYVNCLLQCITSKTHFIMTEKQENPLFYHKCEILLNENGELRKEVKKPFFNKIINDFTVSFISDLPKDMQIVVSDSVMVLVRSILCDEKINEDNIIKIAGSFVILIIFGRYFKYRESVSLFYYVLEMLLIPLFLWRDFIECDNEKNIEKYQKLIDKVNYMEINYLKKIKVMNNFKVKKIISSKSKIPIGKIQKKIEKNIKKLISNLKNADYGSETT